MARMSTMLRWWKRSAVLGLLCLSPLAAQELSVTGGGMTTGGTKLQTYTWQVDYRQNFNRGLAGSVSYINEGHVENHHRDGTAFQLWGRLPLFRDRIAFAVGAGAYYFYDTQPLPGGGPGATANIHGTAPIFSLSATGYLGNRWFVRTTINRISPSSDLQTTTASVGLGYWFGRGVKPTKGRLGDAPDEYHYVTENQLTVFGGQSVVNTFLSQSALAYAMEYRRGLIPHIDWTVSGIYEGDPEIIRRNGLATQVWAVNTFFDERISVGAGLGPYFYIDQKHPRPGYLGTSATMAPLVSLTVSARLSEHWLVRLMFDRVTSDNNRDSDIFLLGLGYRWGGR